MSTSTSIPAEQTRTLPSLHDFFSPGGILANSSLQYEFRRGQLEMAKAVEQALTEKRHLVVEAGTGTGKTLAYLLPALRLAQNPGPNQGRRILISTGTKNLQEQLFFKDIPFLESLLGPLRVTYMKGRANYLCRHKLYALRDHPILNGLEEISQYQAIAEWEKTTETGDRAELALPESSPLFARLDARSEACLGTTCPNYERCFITEMRRHALESDIVIVNHHLFFADLAIKQQAENAPDAGILPEAAAVIFDEAHELEDIASAYFGIGLSNVRFEELVRDIDALLRAKQALATHVTNAAETLRERARLFFAMLPAGDGRMPFDRREEFLETHGDHYLAVRNALTRLDGELGNLRNVEEATGLRHRVQDIGVQLVFLMESTDHNTVFWIERRNTGGFGSAPRGPAGMNAPALRATHSAQNVHLQATPIDVSGLLGNVLFEHYPSVILTSATLTVEGGFAHIRKRLGLLSTRELVVPSHFDYGRQALLYLPEDMPDPRDPSYGSAAAEKIRRVLMLTRGRAFCLFTSFQQMRLVHERLLAELPYPILLQGSSSKKALLEEFRTTPNAVLFGTSSFWQGVDVQGDQLSCVIVDRLPFAVPNDPVVSARMRAIESEGGKPFFDYQVPNAVITLKQGFGRLIRSNNDRGVLVLLDPRLQRQRYGRVFLESLPPYRITQNIGDIADFFDPLLNPAS